MKLSERQTRVLCLAERNDAWWVRGPAGMATARALERRGLAEVHSVVLDSHWKVRMAHYITITDAGREVLNAC